MRIAMLNITGGGISGGYRNYLRHVVPRLARHKNVEALLCVAPSTLELRSWFPPLPAVSFLTCAPFRFLCHQLDRECEEAVREFAPDVVLLPVERFVRLPGVPLVIMMQNMGPLLPVVGNPLSERMRYLAQRAEARIAVRRANHTVVPTYFVRDFLVRRWNVPAQNVTTIHYGAPLLGETVTERKPSNIPTGWGGSFLFTAGSIEPYRGLEDLLKAMCSLGERGVMVPLVIAGYARRNMVGYQRKLMQWIEQQRLQGRIHWVGALQEDELSWCYRRCCAFVMTSRVESFGLIGLEALTHGCYCIAADNPPLPEIFGEAARYYRSGDGNELASAIVQVLSGGAATREAASQRAKDQAARFSWDCNVEKLLATLHDAIPSVSL